METKMMRFLEMSVQAFALASVWRGASAMVANGVTTEQLGVLHNIEPFAISATLLAVIGSAAATHVGFRRWRRAQRVGSHDLGAPRLAEASPAPADQPDQLIADLKHRVAELSREKELLARLLKEKSESMRRDPLTGAFNRLAYEEHLQAEYQRWRRFGNPLALLVWDIDHFKGINDRYGHAAGDAVLRGVAEQLIGRVRATDFVARYGGEEFVMLLPGADRAAALDVADKLRRRVAESVFGDDGAKIATTISCGVACFMPGDSPQSVFDRADQALYRAKNAGRNCCRAA